MNTKLTINLRDGILNVEGSDDFVRSIYEDFKGEVAKRSSSTPAQPPQIEVDGGLERGDQQAEKSKRSARVKRSASEGQKAKVSEYKPTFDPSLDLRGLPEFYDEVQPTKASEKILAFAVFLKEKLQIEPCTVDQIYTCFFTVKDRTKIPEAFVQAFRDTHSRTHFIQFNSLQDVTVTIPGNNHFEAMKKRKLVA